MSKADDRVRVGAVAYLNAFPLTRHLRAAENLCVETVPPSLVAQELENGHFDVGLVPVVQLVRQPELQVVSDFGIAADGPVDSVLLRLHRDPGDLRKVALDPHSRTSQMLTRIVLEERYDVSPEYYEAAPQAASTSSDADASLIIGDPALRLFHEGCARHLDLSTEWVAMTGLPFVFAVWAARPDVCERCPGIEQQLNDAALLGLADREAIVTEQETDAVLGSDVLLEYLNDRIRYRLGPSQREGLDLFLQKVAVREGRESSGCVPGLSSGD